MMTRRGEKAARAARLFLAGDVMLGRGIDQILPEPCDPALHEGYMRSAVGYVELAERSAGPIPRRVDPAYVWGDLPGDLDRRACDLRIVNLETAITRRGRPVPKGINYRVSPANAEALTAARIYACTLANNHVLDWGETGLLDTLDTLARLGVGQAGAGRTAEEAGRPLVCAPMGTGRLLVLAYGHGSAGVPAGWRAAPGRPGVALLPETPEAAVALVRARAEPVRRPGDLLLVSIHWGANWGYEVPEAQRRIAHALIDEAGVAVVCGHSSHHPKGLEIHRGRLILHGCGDLVNDYEGISGHGSFRPDLGLGFVADLAPETGELAGLEILPYRRRAFRLARADEAETRWLRERLARESRLAPWRLSPTGAGTLALLPG